MKYIIFLILFSLSAHGASPKYKVGDCFEVPISWAIFDITRVTEAKYFVNHYWRYNRFKEEYTFSVFEAFYLDPIDQDKCTKLRKKHNWR